MKTDAEIEADYAANKKRILTLCAAVLVLLIALGLVAAWFLHRAKHP
jgi:hypothetical protein